MKTIVLLLLLIFISGCVTDQPVNGSGTEIISEPITDPIIEPGHDTQQNDEPTEEVEPEKEAQTLDSEIDDCLNKEFTVPHIALNAIDEITPLGNLNPPDHTVPTEHLYFGHKEALGKTEFVSPGELRIHTLEFGQFGDYGVRFEVCDNIKGYFGHVHELSDFLKEKFDNAPCYQYTEGMRPREFCEREVDILLQPGDLIGYIGVSDQGSSDFGLVDYRIKLDYVNKSRYGKDGLSKVCALDYFEESIKEKLYAKLEGNLPDACATPMHDIVNTLQGNWFYLEASEGQSSEWNHHLAFVPSNIDPINEVVSIGGVFTDPFALHFKPTDSSTYNRTFKDISADGLIYCYSGSTKFGNSFNGRIIVEMTSETSLKIEKQSGACSGNYSFANPAVYER